MDSTALYKISYGLYIISSMNGNKFNGQIANTLTQVTSNPKKVSITLNKQNFTHEYIAKSNIFSASVLSQETPMEFIGRFGFKSGRDFNKFKGIQQTTGETGVPIVLENSIAYIEAKVCQSLDVGSHTIFVGEIINSKLIHDHEPLTYGYYHKIKGGKSPKNAPTYIENNVLTESEGGDIYKCKICGYKYDPKSGDQEHQVIPGTHFKDLPDYWVCPICGAHKVEFRLL